MSDLHSRIMNLPANPPSDSLGLFQQGYKIGHRDARHAAAELAASCEADLLTAAENALGVLIGCCVGAGGVDDRQAILDAQAMLRSAIRAAGGQA